MPFRCMVSHNSKLLALCSMDVDDEDMRQKLILRIQHLIQLEELLKLALSYAPASMALPICQGAMTPISQVGGQWCTDIPNLCSGDIHAPL